MNTRRSPDPMIAGSVDHAEMVNRNALEIADARRILPTVDWTASPDKQQLDALAASRKLAITHFYTGLQTLRDHYHKLLINVSPVLPAQISGTLIEPDGNPARQIAVSARLPVENGHLPWPDPVTITNEQGAFTLKIPAGIPAPASANIALSFKGANASESRSFTLANLGVPGLIGNVELEQRLDPVPSSIAGSLVSMFGGAVKPVSENGQPATPPVQIRVGDADCPITFDYNLSEERFPYSTLIRLVEPRTSILTETLLLPQIDGEREFGVALRNLGWVKIPATRRSFADRVPVDQPISVDGFRDRIVGNENGVIAPEETVPMAGTLGLGYIVRLAQKWTPDGLSLGDLVYSLPLAPGEQQRIAVFEQRQTLAESEFESLDEEEQQRQRQQADASTQAVFDSAFTESVQGGSSYATHAESSSWGAAGGIGLAIGPLVIGGGAAGGGGSSNASGSSYNWLDGARGYTSFAAETMHNSVDRQATARRRAQRTSIRLASASDFETATTKVITNNNRIHALTVQYWEVLRHFEIATEIEGVTLVCFVPLEVVRFLPPFSAVNLNPADVSDRNGVLRRYGQLLKHADVLRRWLPAQYATGLALLEEFAADPRAVPQLPSSFAEEVLAISLRGSFLPIEDVYVSVLTRRGTRIGPMRMTGNIAPLPDRISDPTHAFATETDLLAELNKRRNDLNGITLSASIALPSAIAPNDVIGFELTRSFRSLTYQLMPKPGDPASDLAKGLLEGLALGPLALALVEQPARKLLEGVNLSPNELEQEIGGPFVWNFSAATGGVNSETYAADYIDQFIRLRMPTGALPIPALQVKPLLKFDDLLKIEQTLQHVIRNTITYSRAVWMSLTPEERAIMLEGYTIGVPADGLADDTQNVPLLNCVANQVMGFYGNSMIMPFSIPKAVADDLNLTTGQIQDALTNFHRTAFSPPAAHIALPTHGVLGEAVLGHCPAAEKIDLTRFWNWQDSPIPQASDISPITLNKGNNLIGAPLPNTLGSLPAMITNVNSGPGASADGSDVLKALIGAQNTKDLPDITGAKDLATLVGETLKTAESARADALGKAQSMATAALNKLPDVLKADSAGKEAAKKDADKAKTSKDAGDKSAFDNLKKNAESYLAVANAEKDQPAANAFAVQIVMELAGSDGLPANWASLLFDAFHVTGSGGDLTQGSKAFLAALGLPLS